jgi:hypothetical protein
MGATAAHTPAGDRTPTTRVIFFLKLIQKKHLKIKIQNSSLIRRYDSIGAVRPCHLSECQKEETK